MKQCTLCLMHVKPIKGESCHPNCWLVSIYSTLPANLKKQAL